MGPRPCFTGPGGALWLTAELVNPVWGAVCSLEQRPAVRRSLLGDASHSPTPGGAAQEETDQNSGVCFKAPVLLGGRVVQRVPVVRFVDDIFKLMKCCI